MIVKCSKCTTLFTLDDTLVKTTGSKVRCSVCKNIFVIYPEGLGKEEQKQDKKKTTNNTKKEKKVSTRNIKINYLDNEDEANEIEKDEIEEAQEIEENRDEEDIEEEIEDEIEEEIEDENIEDIEDDIDEDRDEDTEDETDDEDIEDENIKEYNINDEIDDENIEDEDTKEYNIEEDIDEEDIEKENKKIKDTYDEEKFEDEENFIEKEKDINFKDGILDDSPMEIEEKLKSKKKKPFIALFFTALMVIFNTIIIYYLHTSLINSGKKRPDILENIKVDKNSNLIIDENATIGNKIKKDLRKLLGKQENFPYILPIPSTINSIQIINKKIGYIKIVTGEVVNKSKTTYNAIKIEGILSTKENTKVREQDVICGNLLSQDELRNFSIDEFKTRLQDEKSNEAIEPLKPGERRRFFIVFFNLPNKLTTYHISVKSGVALE